MLVHLLVALIAAAPQLPTTQAGRDTTAHRDSTARDTTASDTTGGRRRREKKPPKRLALTPELLATAFHDSAARDLLLLARAERTRQDSSLASYDATTYQRISTGLGISKVGRDRLAFRSEQATHVQWRRGVGAYVDITGSRAVAPIAGSSATIRMDDLVSPIPYYPGSESLWIGASAVREQVDENDGIVHPLAVGSEAYYTYEVGDSVTFRLPGGKSIRLRELKVRPRVPRWNLAVASLWFDLSGGQLVRAAFRMSVPMDIKQVVQEEDSTAFKDVPLLMRPFIPTMTFSVSAIGVEYGLFEGRFWLPREQVMEGGVTAAFLRVPFKVEQRYTYDNVNAGAPLPPIAVAPLGPGGRNRQRVSVIVSPRDRADSIAEARRDARLRRQCDSTGYRSYTRRAGDNPNPTLVRIPCDSLKLANSPDLPPSIYDKGETVVGSEEMNDLVAQALSMGAQAGFAPQLPTVHFDNMRYNRVEGLSLGGRAEELLGDGYALRASARIGVADLQPDGELSASRSDLRRTLTLTGYNRLVSASDWGNPLSTGSSISALLFGRDEGFYYRASGVELTSTSDDVAGGGLAWSLFGEQERTAYQETNFSVSHAAGGIGFEPNIVADRGVFAGARTRYTGTYGLDPQAFRLFTDFRLEGARGDTASYGRAALDLTASHGIGDGAAALTLAGGSSVGVLPTQRLWFLGGTQTVRGERAGTEAGDAFWLARAELAQGMDVVRPVIFTDFGWAGDRNHLDKIGLPMSGAGFGLSMMDGLIRFDLARGINPDPHWRLDTYVEARF